MPVAEKITAYAARPEGSVSKLSTYRDGWRIMRTIITLYRVERPIWFFGFIGGLLFTLVHGAAVAIADRLRARSRTLQRIAQLRMRQQALLRAMPRG